MITSIKQVYQGFFQQFLGDNGSGGFLRKFLLIDDTRFTVKYFKESSKDYTEASVESYPTISIQPYIPTPKDSWTSNFNKTRDAYYVDETGEVTGGEIFKHSIRYQCRIEVSCAAKAESEQISVINYFIQNFDWSNEACLKISGHQIYGAMDKVYDFIPYKIEASDSPRTDGIFETVYTFNLEFNVYKEANTLISKEEIIESLNLIVTQLGENQGTSVNPLGVSTYEN